MNGSKSYSVLTRIFNVCISELMATSVNVNASKEKVFSTRNQISYPLLNSQRRREGQEAKLLQACVI